MRQRLEEMCSGVTFEAIERVLVQITEKDKVIGQLQQGVIEIRNEVARDRNIEDDQILAA